MYGRFRPLAVGLQKRPAVIFWVGWICDGVYNKILSNGCYSEITMIKKFLLPVVVMSVAAMPVFAQEKATSEKPVSEKAKDENPVAEKALELSKEDQAKVKEVESIVRQQKKDSEGNKATPLSRWIAAENKMIDPLNDLDKESVFILRNKYSTVRVIEVVERDIANAVKSCGKENPDMKSKMEGRFKQWKEAVNPVIDTAKKQLESDIANQTIVDVGEFKKVLKLNDEAYKYSEKQITKTPVSTKEACNSLLASMDDTESDMIKLLQQILLPESVLRQRMYVRPESNKKSFTKAKEKPAATQSEPSKEEAPKQ
jgi:hypothetical protein